MAHNEGRARKALLYLIVATVLLAGCGPFGGGPPVVVDPGELSPPDESPGDGAPGDESPGEGSEPGTGDGEEPPAEPEEPGVRPDELTREVRTLRAGTPQETEVYIIRAPVDGATVMIVGGVHGDETSGWLAAGEIKDWEIDAGTLVVLPQANKSAVQRGRRVGIDELDFNRQFPVGRRPTTALAREVWDIVEQFKPVALLDMHEGWGIFGTHDSVGQTLIGYNAGDAAAFANYVTNYLNTYHVNNRRVYDFQVVGPPVAGSLAAKAGAELGIPAFIAEATAWQTLQSTRVRWQKVYAEQLLRWYDLLQRDELITPKHYRAAVGVDADGRAA